MFGGLHSPGPLPSPQALLELARAFTPKVQALGETPVLLDLFGLGRTFKAPEDLGRALMDAARARRIEANVALAFTRVAALVLARGRPGLTLVPAGGEAAALAPLPLTLLDVGEDRLELFHRWGLHRIGDLAALPPIGLSERLGPEGPRLRRLARGEDREPLVPTPPPESFHAHLELDWAVDGLEPLSFVLSRVLEPLEAALRARGRKAQALTLELTLTDGRSHRRTLRMAAPSGEARTWRTLLLLDLEAHPPGDAVTAVAVTADPTPAREIQFSLLDPAQPSPEKLAETMARLQAFTAEGRGGAVSLLDSHRPGAFVMGMFGVFEAKTGRLATDRLPTGHSNASNTPPGVFEARAGRLAAGHSRSAGRNPGVARPATTAVDPRPAVPRAALRAFRPPLHAEVMVKDGAPSFVAAPGVRGPVEDRAGPWRTSGDWWDAAWAREEWDVLVAGRLLRLVRDRLREKWLIDGEID
jgi:protein ImuB